MVQTESLVSGLDKNEDSALTTAQMNAISTARLDGTITDAQADQLIKIANGSLVVDALDDDEFAVASAIGADSYVSSQTALGSTYYSAAKGNIAQNEELLSIVQNADTSLNTGLFPWQHEDINVAGFMSSGNLVNAVKSDTIESDAFIQRMQDAYVKDTISDGVVSIATAKQLQVENGYVTGVNTETVSPQELGNMVNSYFAVVNSTTSDGQPYDYVAANTELVNQRQGFIAPPGIIESTVSEPSSTGFMNDLRVSMAALDGNPQAFAFTGQGYNNLAVAAATIDISDSVRNLSATPEIKERMLDSWANLGEQAKESGLVLSIEQLQNQTLSSREDVYVNSNQTKE
jgi:hypothetical protein